MKASGRINVVSLQSAIGLPLYFESRSVPVISLLQKSVNIRQTQIPPRYFAVGDKLRHILALCSSPKAAFQLHKPQ